MSVVRPRRVLSLSQGFRGFRVLVLTERKEVVGADRTGQSQPLRAQSEPLTGHALAFVVIIAHAQMFPEVTLCILQAVLRLGGDHTTDSTGTEAARCVATTPVGIRPVLNCQCEHEHNSTSGPPTLGHLSR